MVSVVLWGAIFSILLLAWSGATIQLNKYKKPHKVAALLFGRVFVWVFFITIFLRYWILFQIINDINQLQVPQTPYQYFFQALVTHPLALQYVPQIAQSIGYISILFLGFLTAVVTSVIVLAYPKSDPRKWSKSLLPSAMTYVFLIGSCLGAYLLSSNPNNTMMHISDIFDLNGMIPVLLFNFYIWMHGDLFIEDVVDEFIEEDMGSKKYRDILPFWIENKVIVSPNALMTLSGSKNPEQDKLSTKVWRSVGGNSLAPNGLDDLRNYLENRVYFNPSQNLGVESSGQAWMINNLPQPTETQFLASSAVIGILKGLRVLVVVPNESVQNGDNQIRADHPGSEMYKCIKQSLETFSGVWQAGKLVLGTEFGQHNLRSCFSKHMLPSCLIVQLDELDKIITDFWKIPDGPDGKNHYFAPNIGLIIVSGFDSGDLVELTNRVFILKRLTVALNVRGANYSVLSSTDSGDRTRVMYSNAFNGVETIEINLGPKEQSALSIWKADEAFVNKDIYDWPTRAVKGVPKSEHSVHVTDFMQIFDAASIQGALHDITRLQRNLMVEGDASIVMTDEQNLVKLWRQVQNRTSVHPNGHNSLWFWQKSLITNIFKNPKNMEELRDKKLLPYPTPAIGMDCYALVKLNVEKLLFESGGSADETSFEQLSILQRYANYYLTDLESNNKYALRRHNQQGDYKRVRILKAQNVTRSSLFGHDVVRNDTSKYCIQDIGGGGSIIGVADAKNVKLRYYQGRVFAIGARRYKVEMKEGAYDDKNRVVYVRQCNPKQNFITEPILNVLVKDVNYSESDIQQYLRISNFEQFEIIAATINVEVKEEIMGYIPTDDLRQPVLLNRSISETYKTRSRAIFFPHMRSKQLSKTAYRHVAELFDRVLLAYLNAGDDDVHVCEFGFRPGENEIPIVQKYGPGILFLDRNPSSGREGDLGGMGVHTVLDRDLIENMINFSRYVLSKCPKQCGQGCVECSPIRLFDIQVSNIQNNGKSLANKKGALDILNHR